MPEPAVDRTLHLPRKRVSSGVLFVDPAGRILLVQPNYKPYWDLPGGIVETGESPRDAAQRETKEELGVIALIGRLLVVDYMPPRPDLTEAVMFVYAGHGLRAHGADIVLADGELTAWAWCTPAEQAERQVHAPILAARIAAARRAHAAETTIYLEAGQEIAA
jgi:ADP-ribose pyrophosphatase YjhB (NUDIX family)